MTDGHPRPQGPWGTAGNRERPVLPTGALRRGSRLAVLPLQHAARTAAAATRLSRAAADQVTARTAQQLLATLGELKGGAAKLGQTMSVFEAAMPEEVAAPYRSALRRLTDAQLGHAGRDRSQGGRCRPHCCVWAALAGAARGV